MRVTADLIYPPLCALCQCRLSSPAELICEPCQTQLLPVSTPCCDRCGFPLETPDQSCEACQGRTLHFLRARSALMFNQPVQALIHLLKYRRRRSIGVFLGECLGKIIVCEPWFAHIDTIVPLPLHSVRLRERGYNQSERIAKGFADYTGVPMNTGLVVRRRPTKTQTRLSIEQRRENVKDAFATPPGQSLKGRHIVLVDDVLTTGASLDSCARALVDGGAAAVYALTVARA